MHDKTRCALEARGFENIGSYDKTTNGWGRASGNTSARGVARRDESRRGASVVEASRQASARAFAASRDRDCRVERRRAGRIPLLDDDALFQLPLHDAHPWEHELAHAAHEQVEHPQEEHFAAHWQLPEAQPQPSEQEQAIVREEEYGEGGPRGKEWGSGTSRSRLSNR